MVAHELGHDLTACNEIDEGDVGNAEQQAAQHTEEGAEARIITDDLGHAEKSGLERGCAGGDKSDVGVAEKVVCGIAHEGDGIGATEGGCDDFTIETVGHSGGHGYHRCEPAGADERLGGQEHAAEVVADFLATAAGQEGKGAAVGTGLPVNLLIGLDFVKGGIAHVMDGVLMTLAVVIDFERENGQHEIDVAAYAAYAALLPCPNLGGYVIAHGTQGTPVYETGNAEVETGIVDENDDIRLPEGDGLLAAFHAPEYSGQMGQYGQEAHVGQLAVVTQECASHLLHGVASIVTEFGFRVTLAKSNHKMGGVQIAAGFASYQEIFHRSQSAKASFKL